MNPTPDVHPDWHGHDLNQGYRDALALLTATHAEDIEARALIARAKCCSCMTEALVALLLSCIDEVWDGDITGFAHALTEGLEL